MPPTHHMFDIKHVHSFDYSKKGHNGKQCYSGKTTLYPEKIDRICQSKHSLQKAKRHSFKNIK